jgi:hypothetical protein
MSQPRSPSVEDIPSHAPRRNRRGRSRTPRSLSASSYEEDYHPERRRQKKNQGGLPAIDDVQETVGGVTKTATGAVDKVGDTAGALTGGGKKEGGDDTLSLRLDLNLDVYVKLKAKVHGDLTLSLL